MNNEKPHEYLALRDTGYMTINSVIDSSGIVDNDIPIIIPKFLASEFKLPAIPSLFGFTEDIIIELLGDWKSATPTPVIVVIETKYGTEVLWSININKNCVIVTITNPINVKISDPILSERLPLIGATIIIAIGTDINIKPAVSDEKPNDFWR